MDERNRCVDLSGGGRLSRKTNKKYIDVSSGKHKKRVSLNWRKMFSFLFFLILGLAGGLLIYAYKTLYSFNYENIKDDLQFGGADGDVAGTGSLALSNDMVLNVLLLGTDSQSAGDGGRSDSILVVSVDARHKKFKITSLMRDLWVKIPGHAQDRINAAYAYGGPKLTMDTIKSNFGITIDRYAFVDFDNFEHIVDSVGGIDVDLSSAEVTYINKNSGNRNGFLRGSGLMHLNGRQALTHCRNRDSIGSDYDRTRRQRDVLKAMFEKAKTLNIAQIPKLISTIAPMVTTNFRPSEIARLASNSPQYVKFNVEQFRLPTDDNVKSETIDHKMVLVIGSLKKAREDIFSFIYEERPDNLGTPHK